MYLAKITEMRDACVLIDSNERICRNTSRCFPLVFLFSLPPENTSCILLLVSHIDRVEFIDALHCFVFCILHFAQRGALESLMRRGGDFNKCAKAVPIEFYWPWHPFDLYVITFYYDARLSQLLKSALHFTRT